MRLRPAHQGVIVAAAGLLAGCVAVAAVNPYGIGATSLLAFTAGIVAAILLIVAWRFTAGAIARREHIAASDALSISCLPYAAFAMLPSLYVPFLIYEQRRTVLADSPQLGTGWQVAMLLVLSALLVLALLALRFTTLRRGPLQYMADHPAGALTAMVVLWTAAAIVMDISKTTYMHESNTAIFLDVLRHAFSDKGPLYSSLLQVDGASLLGVHASLIWYAVYPFFKVFPSFTTITVIADTALGLAAIPVYFIARRYFSSGFSLLLVAVFLLNRAILAQPGAGDLSEMRFMPVFFLTAYYFWDAKRFLPFIIFSVLAMTIREDVGVVIVLLGLLSLLRRRDLKWVLVPVAAGISWTVAAMSWLIPTMNPTGEAARSLALYKELGDSNSEVLRNFFTRPWLLVRLMVGRLQNLAMIYGLWQSFGFGVVLLSASVILAIPAVAETLLVKHTNLNHHNAIFIAATLFPALIVGLHNADRITRRRLKTAVSGALIILTLFATASLSYSWFSLSRYQPRYNHDSAMAILEEIPAGSSVIMPTYMLIRADESWDISGYQQVSTEEEQIGRLVLEQEYVIIDTSDIPDAWKDVQEFKGLAMLKAELESSQDYVLIYSGEDLQLFRRNKTGQ